MANRNTVWSEVLAEELAKVGLQEVCLAPGSRSTPLVLAIAAHPNIKIYTHLDERSAGFFALGLAKASMRPVALVCTSGTAAANFFPAVIEAHQSGVPLLVLSADRPFELRDSGANQSIDQVRLYGSFALWSVDVALPEAQPEAVFIRSLRTLAARAYATATGPRPGVVHLNLPFRKPLEPTPVPNDLSEPPADATERAEAFTRVIRPTPKLESNKISELGQALSECKSGIIICGVDCPREAAFLNALNNLSGQTGFPILTDAASGLRFSELGTLAGFDSYLATDCVPQPEFILRFGRAPTSAPLQRYLAGLEPKENWQVSAAGLWADETHQLTRFIKTDEVDFCEQLTQALKVHEYQSKPELKERFSQLETLNWNFWQDKLEEEYFDGSIGYNLVQSLPDDSVLFVGNSLSVRHLEQFGYAKNKSLDVYANRGASGIDGNISTALGLGAAHSNKPLFMLLGDLTLYHDMNGLWGLRHLKNPVTVVLLNNNGGGIFRRLPIADYEPEFSQYFLTPPDLDFKHTAALYGLEYIKVDSLESFQQALSKATYPKLIDVQTDSAQDADIRNSLMKQYQTFIKENL